MKGYIYIIRSHQTDDVYYGSTIQLLCQRMSNHRADCKRYIDGKSCYVSSYEITQYDDAYIELVEEVEFQNRQELFAREGHYIRENKCVNKCIAGRTQKEYNNDNIEEVRKHNNARSTKFYIANKAKVSQTRKEYYQKNIQKFKEYYQKNKIELTK